MKDIKIIDNFIDDREFRNYVNMLLLKMGYKFVTIDDARIADKIINNDNDMLAWKDDKKYTVQTYLNREITEKEINETKRDMKKEKVFYGIIVTNKEVSEDIKTLASKNNISLIDRKDFKYKL